jgi:hypothetical protein
MKKQLLIFTLFIGTLWCMQPRELLEKFEILTAEKRKITSHLNITQLTIIDIRKKGIAPSENLETKVCFLKKELLAIQNQIINLRRYFFNGVPLLKVSLAEVRHHSPQ